MRPVMVPKQIDDYIVDRHLGKGAYGALWRGRAVCSGEVVVVRVVYRWATEEVERLSREVQILRRLSHDNVVRLRDLKKTASRFYQVFEAWNCGDLAQLLRARGALPEATALQFVSQIAAGLEALHSQVGEPHGDLRPGNILLKGPLSAPPSGGGGGGGGSSSSTTTWGSSSSSSSSGSSSSSSGCSRSSCSSSSCSNSAGIGGSSSSTSLGSSAGGARSVAATALPTVKLANFGFTLSRGYGCSVASPYVAPEVLRGEPHGLQADLWSVGVILHELLTGRTPFAAAGADRARLLEAMGRTHEELRISLGGGFCSAGEDARRLVALMLSPRPEDRPPSSEVLRLTTSALGRATAAAAIDGTSSAQASLLVGRRLEVPMDIAALNYRSSAGTDLAPIQEVDGEFDDLLQSRDEAAAPCPSEGPANDAEPAMAGSLRPVSGQAALGAALTAFKAALPAAAGIAPMASVPRWGFSSPVSPLQTLFQCLAAHGLGPSSLAGQRRRPLWAFALAPGDEEAAWEAAVGDARSSTGPYRDTFLLAVDSLGRRGPVTAFCVGQIRASHLFRLRTAQLFPRVLYSL